MTAVELSQPAVADFDLAITGGGAVADNEMVGKTVRHPAHMPMVIVEYASVTLPGTAVVHDDILPSVTRDPSIVDGFAYSRREVLPTDTAAA